MGCGAAKPAQSNGQVTEGSKAQLPPPILKPGLVGSANAAANEGDSAPSATPASATDARARRKKSVVFEQDIKTIKFENGDIYKGLVANDKRNGYGKFTWANEDSYDGEWLNNEKHGTGTFSWHNGDQYEGTYQRNMRQGQGTYTYSSGDVYEGEWKGDKRDGEGSYTASNPLEQYVYEGKWSQDSKHGRGIQKWGTGTTYDGEWVTGQRHGQGTQTEEGSTFVGTFTRDQKSDGKITFSDGTVYEGVFKDDKPDWPQGHPRREAAKNLEENKA